MALAYYDADQFSDSPAQACYPTANEFDVIWDTPVSNQSCPISAAQLFGYAVRLSSLALSITIIEY